MSLVTQYQIFDLISCKTQNVYSKDGKSEQEVIVDFLVSNNHYKREIANLAFEQSELKIVYQLEYENFVVYERNDDVDYVIAVFTIFFTDYES